MVTIGVPFLAQVTCLNCGGVADKFVLPSDDLQSPSASKIRVVVAGLAGLDIVASAPQLVANNSNIGQVSMTPGGVARNSGECLHRLGIRVSFCSIVGDDLFGRVLLDYHSELGMDNSQFTVFPHAPTSIYHATFDGMGTLYLLCLYAATHR